MTTICKIVITALTWYLEIHRKMTTYGKYIKMTAYGEYGFFKSFQRGQLRGQLHIGRLHHLGKGAARKEKGLIRSQRRPLNGKLVRFAELQYCKPLQNSDDDRFQCIPF